MKIAIVTNKHIKSEQRHQTQCIWTCKRGHMKTVSYLVMEHTQWVSAGDRFTHAENFSLSPSVVIIHVKRFNAQNFPAARKINPRRENSGSFRVSTQLTNCPHSAHKISTELIDFNNQLCSGLRVENLWNFRSGFVMNRTTERLQLAHNSNKQYGYSLSSTNFSFPFLSCFAFSRFLFVFAYTIILFSFQSDAR